MAKGIHIVPESLINGSYGELIDASGNFLGNVQGVDFQILNKKRVFTPVGSSREVAKQSGTSGTGTIEQFKLTSAFLQLVGTPMWNGRSQIKPIQLWVNLDDPEAIGAEQVTLIGVKLWEINGGWRVNDVVTEKMPFTFMSLVIPTKIEYTETAMYEDHFSSRYPQQRNL